jgi:hypothetical protein
MFRSGVDSSIHVPTAFHWRTIHVPYAIHWRTQPSPHTPIHEGGGLRLPPQRWASLWHPLWMDVRGLGTPMECECNVDGTPMERGWNVDTGYGTRMERGWNVDSIIYNASGDN